MICTLNALASMDLCSNSRGANPSYRHAQANNGRPHFGDWRDGDATAERRAYQCCHFYVGKV